MSSSKPWSMSKKSRRNPMCIVRTAKAQRRNRGRLNKENIRIVTEHAQETRGPVATHKRKGWKTSW